MQNRTLIMKFISISLLRKFGLLIFLSTLHTIGYSQKENKNWDKNELTVEKRTVLERFDSDLVISPEARMKLKMERVATIKKRLEIIDTLNISERQRRRLLKELYLSPFSDKWNKVIVDLEFEEETH